MPSGDLVESGDRKVGGSGGDTGVSAVLSGDWGGVRGRGRGGGGIFVLYVWGCPAGCRAATALRAVAKGCTATDYCVRAVGCAYICAQRSCTAEMLVPYRTLAKSAADKISVLSYARVELASGCPRV